MPSNRAEYHPQSVAPLAHAGLGEGVDFDWSFAPTRPDWRIALRRLRERLRRRPFPPVRTLTPPDDAGDWTLFFVFAPDGTINDDQRDTLRRLRALPRRLLVVCASPSADDIPAEIATVADALVWKGTAGFDFSAYAAGLAALAHRAAGSDVFVLNDSVIGPLGDMAPWFAAARWDLTGFTASSNVENHIQSYAWLLRDVTETRLKALAPALSTSWAYDNFWGVVLNQETRLARVAARHMSVGAFVHTDAARIEDPTWGLALPLLHAGFPFLKRSLIGGKLSHLHDEAEIREALARYGSGEIPGE